MTPTVSAVQETSQHVGMLEPHEKAFQEMLSDVTLMGVTSPSPMQRLIPKLREERDTIRKN
ncbi:hypothetical protein C6502_08245 [Candidatus Poribacteria bacterium]|nr:MAG: hypothetical protein C6502_08245 [Candidatus Poribacteria bacterium]